jgi:thiopurine S-methyltransferase
MPNPPKREFESRNAADAAFWDERFARQFTPWDAQGVPAEFEAFAAGLTPCPTLVPGCGNGWEAGWLHARGWPVTAIDFSAEAVASARRALGAAAVVVREADFFAFTPEPPCQLIYERAFLCALPPAMRPQVAARWAELLPPGGLLAGFFYFDDAPKGPPFGIGREELENLLEPHFTLVADEPVQDSIAVFQGKERWMTWRRR